MVILASPMKHHKHMIFLLNITRTDNLGESREEAKKLLEEVEAMEREAHQVIKERYLWWSLLSFCGSCSNRILHYFPLSVRVSVRVSQA